MLAEILLLLSGHPSSFFIPSPAGPSTPKTLVTSPKLEPYLHPGEVSTLYSLADLAFKYTRVRAYALKVQKAGRDAILGQTSSASKGKQRASATGTAGEAPNQYLTTLAGSILEVLREWEVLIVDLETRILSLDPGLVQDAHGRARAPGHDAQDGREEQAADMDRERDRDGDRRQGTQMGYVPLSTLVAAVSPWRTPLTGLSTLVDQLSRSGTMSPGRLIRLVNDSRENGNPKIREIFTTLSAGLERLFLTHLTTFILDGITGSASSSSSSSYGILSLGLDNGRDPLAPSHRVYILNEGMIPPGVSYRVRESILYIGRVSATLRREERSLPRQMITVLRQEIMAVRALDTEELDRVISKTRAEIGEWLWKNVLTGRQVMDALESFGDYLLTRNAEFTINTIREIHRLRLNKLIVADPHSSSSVIREQDVDLAMLRASVGTGAENDRSLEKLRFKLERGAVRPLLSHLSPVKSAKSKRQERGEEGGVGGMTGVEEDKDKDNPYKEEDSTRDLFSSFILGSPLTLESTITWPLDLFMTPPSRSVYTDIHTYLFALRDTHLRVLDTWTSLSSAQRQRRKWTGASEGGTADEVDKRRKLARAGWGVVRIMLFFLDQLIGHFTTDIIDVQHRRLMDELEEIGSTRSGGGAGAGAGIPTSDSAPASLRGSMRIPTSTSVSRLGSPVSKTKASASWRGGDQSTLPSSPAGSDSQNTTLRLTRPGTPTLDSSSQYLDFLSLRTKHSQHLAFLRHGLLLADRGIASIIRDILETCVRFTGLVERWGGDVLPELLVEGSSGEDVGQLVTERAKAVSAVNDELYDHISTFFRALLETQNPPPAPGSSSNAEGQTSTNGISFSRTARTAQMIHSSRVMSRQISLSKVPTNSGFANVAVSGQGAGGKTRGGMSSQSEKSAEADALMARHIEQLVEFAPAVLLRLDFNGILTEWMENEANVNNTEVLAEGGL